MAGKAKYIVGEKIGPYNILFLERLSDIKGRFKCPKCGREDWKTRISRIGIGETKSCGCNRKKYKVGESLGPYNIKFLERIGLDNTGKNYIGNFECPFCGETFTTAINNVTSGHTVSCGCYRSKGEKIVKEVLNELNISYRTEKTFKDCINPKTKHVLRFDFYLPDYNCCIEYDGKQHQLGWTNKELPQDIQYRDKIKNQYCKNNNIKLIRISYTDLEKIDCNYILSLLERI